MNLPWGKNRRSGTNPWHQFSLRRMLISRDFWSLFMAVPHFVLCLQEDMYTDIYIYIIYGLFSFVSNKQNINFHMSHTGVSPMTYIIIIDAMSTHPPTNNGQS